MSSGACPRSTSTFEGGSGSRLFGPSTLKRIREFYDANAEKLDGFEIPTIDFVTGAPTNLHYPKAKLIDMVFFVAGY